MAAPLLPIITDAGIAAAFAADDLGLSVSITKVGIGDTGWTPDSTATALTTEQVQVDIANGSNPAPNQVHLAALFAGPEEFWIREVGFYLADLTLFAVWSHPTEVIGYKSALADFLLSLDIVMTEIPPGSVTITSTEDALSVGNAADIAAVVARVDIIEPVYTIAPDLPLAPNLLPDSKKFTALCGGLLDTPQAWDAGGLGGAWIGAWYLGTTGTLSIEVIDAADETAMTAAGLWPLGDLGQMVVDVAGVPGRDVHVAVFDINITGAGSEFTKFVFTHSQTKYTSWEVGQFGLQTSAFINVISCSADIRFDLFTNAYPGATVDASHIGLGWKHYANTNLGVKGFRFSRVAGALDTTIGAMKFAVALPYLSLGNHHGMPLWAGYIGEYLFNDTV